MGHQPLGRSAGPVSSSLLRVTVPRWGLGHDHVSVPPTHFIVVFFSFVRRTVHLVFRIYFGGQDPSEAVDLMCL